MMITTVTLNASIDKAYFMDRRIENGTVMRVASCRNSAGGKGMNVARIVKLCKEEVQATGFTGGFNGAYLESLLEQDGIFHRFVHVKAETRSCINILDEGYGSTEYLEPGEPVTREEETAFLECFPKMIQDSSVVTISGSVPRGISKDIYQSLVQCAKDLGKQVILDTNGELLENGLKACPTMVKPNQDEIEALFGIQVKGFEDVVSYAQKIYEMGIPNVVISLGGDGALLVCSEGVFQGRPPKLEVVNTVGCGDSMVGALAVALKRKAAPKDALRYAVATATAAALSSETGCFEPEVQERLLSQVKIERVGINE
ncbi:MULTISPECIES: 1-phosphofructokinase [Faecalicatena]|nr:1-phosphofructokinase [Lachnospiraceae bacterium]